MVNFYKIMKTIKKESYVLSKPIEFVFKSILIDYNLVRLINRWKANKRILFTNF